MRELGFTKAYETVMEFAPSDVQDILRRQLPVIEKSIDEQVDAFGKALGEKVQASVAAAADEIVAQQQKEMDDIKDQLAGLEKSLGRSSKAVKDKAGALQNSLNEWEKRLRGIGKTVRTTVDLALKGSGLPMSINSLVGDAN